MEVVVENKNLPGNGLTDSVSPEEVEPLRKKKSFFKSSPKSKKEKMALSHHRRTADVEMEKGDRDVDSDPEDDNTPGSNNDNRSTKSDDVLSSCAYKCRLTPKKGLIYLIVCSIIIFILLFILILLAAIWPHSSNLPTCKSGQCHLFSSQILSSLNSSVKPCEDFWEFSCGGWLHTHPIPKSRAHWSVEQLEQFNLKEKLRNLINTLPFYVESASQSVNQKMKTFYQSCMGLEYIEADEDKPLKRIIQNLGGWQVLRNFRQNEFDFPRVLRKIQGEYRTSPFFRIEVVPNPRVPTRNIIKISPAGLSLPDKEYYFRHEDPLVMGRTGAECSKRCRDMLLNSLQKFYFEQRKSLASSFRTYAKDVVQILGATSTQASQFSDEIFSFEKRIAEITPNPLDLTDPIETFNKLTVSELKSKSNTIFWGELLKAIFPQGSINDQTEVLTTSIEYLEEISSIISSTDKRNLNNYLMWHLTQRYLPYLSKQFTEALEMYRRESTGNTEYIPRWEFCSGELFRFFPHAVNYLLSRNCDDREEKISKVEVIFDTLSGTLTERLSTSAKFDESMRNYALDKLRLMGIQIGTTLTNITTLEDLYFPLDTHKGDFFLNVLQATSFQSQMEQKELANPNKDSAVLRAFSSAPFRIQFIPTANKIIVPETALQKPVLNLQNNHLPIVYGSIGVEIAEALALAFGLDGGLYWSNGVLMSEKDPKAQETRDLINARRICLSSFFTNIRLDDEPYIERTSLDSTMHLAGIQIAYNAINNHVFYGEFLALPDLDQYSPTAQFFLAYGQSQCSSSSLLYHDLEHSTFTSLSHDHRTRGVLRQLVGFTKAMECPINSEMYADFTCDYII